jgi:hypothetical protein
MVLPEIEAEIEAEGNNLSPFFFPFLFLSFFSFPSLSPPFAIPAKGAKNLPPGVTFCQH